MDIEKTREYYDRLSRLDLCDCSYCQNYIREASSAYPEVAEYLSGLGADIEKPLETIPLEPDETGRIGYIAQYVICGSPDGFQEGAIGSAHARIAELHPTCSLADPHFVIEISPIRLRDVEKLVTPFGEIDILIDGRKVPYVAREGKRIECLCPDVSGRFQITIEYVPDGKKHSIACVFTPSCPCQTDSESGERLECQGFYSERRIKMSIGVECESGCFADGTRASDRYDYDADYLENGMAYLILPGTRTERYTFGISWVDDVGWDDPIEDGDRGVQTWYGADPTLSL